MMLTERAIQAIQGVRKRGSRPGLGAGQRRFVLIVLVPGILHLLVFRYYTVLNALNLSFRRYNLLSPETPFVGLQNYLKTLGDPRFLRSIWNSFYYAIASTLAGIILALAIALLINSIRTTGLAHTFRTLYFLPQVTSTVAIGLVWQWLYQPVYGLFNQLLKAMGLPTLGWLQSIHWAMPSIIIVGVWAGLGISIVILLAGLSGIPRDFYEACRVDGGNSYHVFRYITLPLLKPTLTFMLVSSFMSGFNVFGLVFIMSGGGGTSARGGPLDRTRVSGLHLYQTAFEQLKMGEASAMAFVIFAIVLVITILQLRLLQTEWEY